MDKSSSQPKRMRKPFDRRGVAIFFVFSGIFFIVIRGAGILRLLLPGTEIASPLAELMVFWAALLWLGVMVLLARYAKLLHRILVCLLFVPFFGSLIYSLATTGASDRIASTIFRIILGLMYLMLAPAFWLEHKLDKQATTTAWNYKPWLRALIVVLGLIVLWNSTNWMVYPSRFRLCRDVAEYVPLQECIALENNLAIVQRAFPEGEVTEEKVDSALGRYFQAKGIVIGTDEFTRSYRLGVTPIDILNHRYDDYYFLYNKNGVLRLFRYTDF